MENANKKGRKARSKDFDSVFASRLRKLLSERETTQQQLSEGITATRQAINKWANGETVPDVIAAAEIAKYFGVSVDYLLGLTENQTTDEDIKVACKVTGLSENAVKKLKRLKLYNETISKFIDCEQFTYLMGALECASDVHYSKAYFESIADSVGDIIDNQDYSIELREAFLAKFPFVFYTSFYQPSLQDTNVYMRNGYCDISEKALLNDLLSCVVAEMDLQIDKEKDFSEYHAIKTFSQAMNDYIKNDKSEYLSKKSFFRKVLTTFDLNDNVFENYVFDNRTIDTLTNPDNLSEIERFKEYVTEKLEECEQLAQHNTEEE